ncbi:hypothetical protein CCR96_14000 [Halochromatium roseum]|nr:hypothetical protein [Halochromatium roseum]
MAESVYIESSVISYFTARPSRDLVITARQAITESWWHDHRFKYEIFIIGIAAASGVNFLLTWNFKHINNAHTKALISSIIEAHGFVSPILCSPEELGAEI